MRNKIKPIAIHLPQFHPFQENDEWWGKGFTEWTNVTKAKPLFKGHYQPHLPADLGFYDLRLEEARLAQIALAKQYGIYGFCYYHYWFNGKRLMHEPLDRMLANKKEDFPFMLCWANENWTRRWDGQEHEILIKQDYGDVDNEAHINFLCKSFFADERYIKVKGAPILLIYRASIIPEVAKFIIKANQIAQNHGFPSIHFLCMDNFVNEDALGLGFHAAVHFHPDYRYFERSKESMLNRVLNKLKIKKSFILNNHYQTYKSYIESVMTNKLTLSSKIYPGITPGWDNTARRKGGAIVLDGATPNLFRKWLKDIILKENDSKKEENFLFVNAWNEWAECNHMEPCKKWGKKYLEVLKQEIEK